jgi:hypothetical protein
MEQKTQTQTHTVTALIFDKGAQICIGEKTDSSTNVTGKTGYPPSED